MREIVQFVSRYPVSSIVWIVLLATILSATSRGPTSRMKVITCGEATRLINKEDTVVVDLCQRDDFRKGHIVDSANPLPSEIKANDFGELKEHKNKPVIVTDGSGMQRQDLATALIKAGFEQMSVLKDGMAGWGGENLSLAHGK